MITTTASVTGRQSLARCTCVVGHECWRDGAYDMWLVAHTDCQICMEPLQQDPGDPGEQIINLINKSK